VEIVRQSIDRTCGNEIHRGKGRPREIGGSILSSKVVLVESTPPEEEEAFFSLSAFTDP
jgi:hypothetical protein